MPCFVVNEGKKFWPFTTNTFVGTALTGARSVASSFRLTRPRWHRPLMENWPSNNPKRSTTSKIWSQVWSCTQLWPSSNNPQSSADLLKVVSSSEVTLYYAKTCHNPYVKTESILFSQNVQKLLDQKAMVTIFISQRSCASQSFILDCLILIHL